MIFQVKGSGGKEYSVDSEEVTCTCPDFFYRRSFNQKYSRNRLCKHLVQVYNDHPEIKPFEVPFSNETSKSMDQYPSITREEIEEHVSLSINALNMYEDKVKFSQVGDYVIGKSEVSDGIRFYLSTEEPFIKLSEFFGRMTFSDPTFISDLKSNFVITGRISIEIVKFPYEELYTRSLFHNSGKSEILRLIRSAYVLGFELSLHGIIDNQGRSVIPNSEVDIYNMLGEMYKLPKDRWT